MGSRDNMLLVKISTTICRKIAQDIELTNNAHEFAMLTGLSNEEIVLLPCFADGRFPAQNIMNEWFSKSPRVVQLAELLVIMSLEKSFYRLKDCLEPETFEYWKQELIKKRSEFADPRQCENTKDCHNDAVSTVNNDSCMASTSGTSCPNTPEPGIVSITFPRSSPTDYVSVDNIESVASGHSVMQHQSCILIQNMLQQRSVEWSSSEFNKIEYSTPSFEGRFSSHFTVKGKSINVFIRKYCLTKVLKSSKEQRKVFNLVWCHVNYQHPLFPSLTGFRFVNDSLFLIFPHQNCQSLYNELHRPNLTKSRPISAHQRLSIARKVGDGLSYLHELPKFNGYHGQVTSHNVLISGDNVKLTGFDKFCSPNSDYMNGLRSIKNSCIDFDHCFHKDKVQYLELIVELWWNIPPYNDHDDYSISSLITDIVNVSIVNPKVIYSEWNETINEQIRSVVCQCIDGTQSIAEILNKLTEGKLETHQC